MAKVQVLKQNGYNFLWIDGFLWMWDIPEEIKDQKEIAAKAYGDVLVAGYGLGVIQRHFVRNKEVKSLLTVEKLQEVIDACKKEYGRIYGKVAIADFYRYKTDMRFDCVIGDIWPDQASRHIKLYIKFKKKAESLLKPGGKILGWGSDYFEYLLKKGGSSPIV